MTHAQNGDRGDSRSVRNHPIACLLAVVSFFGCQHHEERYGRLLRFQKGGGRQVDDIKTIRFDRAWRFSQRPCFIVSRSQS
jgi:hypothetical protein